MLPDRDSFQRDDVCVVVLRRRACEWVYPPQWAIGFIDWSDAMQEVEAYDGKFFLSGFEGNHTLDFRNFAA